MPPGKYYFFTCIEYPNKIYNCSSKNDSNEYSSIDIIPVKHSDIVVQPINISNNNLTSGQYFDTTISIKNIGNGNSTNSSLKYYLSSDSVISTSDTLLSTDRVGPLDTGGVVLVNETLTSPSNEGMFWVGACVEPVLNEINTTNNCSSGKEISVTAPSSGIYRADVNGDGNINSADAMLTLRYSVGLDMNQTNWHQSPTTGDVNCDGATTTTDAMLILRKSVGLDMQITTWCLN